MTGAELVWYNKHRKRRCRWRLALNSMRNNRLPVVLRGGYFAFIVNMYSQKAIHSKNRMILQSKRMAFPSLRHGFRGNRTSLLSGIRGEPTACRQSGYIKNPTAPALPYLEGHFYFIGKIAVCQIPSDFSAFHQIHMQIADL